MHKTNNMLWQVCVSPNESKWDADCSGSSEILHIKWEPQLNARSIAFENGKSDDFGVLGGKNNNDNKQTPHLPFVLDTGHQQREQVEGEEDAQAEQHALHIHTSCGQWEQKSRSKSNLIKK